MRDADEAAHMVHIDHVAGARVHGSRYGNPVDPGYLSRLRQVGLCGLVGYAVVVSRGLAAWTRLDQHGKRRHGVRVGPRFSIWKACGSFEAWHPEVGSHSRAARRPSGRLPFFSMSFLT